VILLKPRSKEPQPRAGGHWIASNLSEVQRHLAEGGNIGICAGPLIILDFDEPGALAEMSAELCPLQPWVRTGSGKTHCYATPMAGLPPKIMWRGARVGEVQRLPTQYVVAPPSIHPSGGRYEWLVDPVLTPLPGLPPAWVEYLARGEVPEYIQEGDRRGHPEEEAWSGPPPEVILRSAMAQPGARNRGGGIKFQCPQCAADGHDRHMDNAKVFLDGRWGCAYDPTHGRAIGIALGVLVAAVEEQRDFPLSDVAPEPEPESLPLSDEPGEESSFEMDSLPKPKGEQP